MNAKWSEIDEEMKDIKFMPPTLCVARTNRSHALSLQSSIKPDYIVHLKSHSHSKILQTPQMITTMAAAATAAAAAARMAVVAVATMATVTANDFRHVDTNTFKMLLLPLLEFCSLLSIKMRIHFDYARTYTHTRTHKQNRRNQSTGWKTNWRTNLLIANSVYKYKHTHTRAHTIV